MDNIPLKIRILLESIFLGLGGVALWLIVTMYFYSPFEERFGLAGGTVFYVILTLLVMITAIWILTERRKDLGERIRTGTYIVLNMIPFLSIGLWILLYISSFD